MKTVFHLVPTVLFSPYFLQNYLSEKNRQINVVQCCRFHFERNSMDSFEKRKRKRKKRDLCLCLNRLYDCFATHLSGSFEANVRDYSLAAVFLIYLQRNRTREYFSGSVASNIRGWVLVENLHTGLRGLLSSSDALFKNLNRNADVCG